MPKYIAVPRLNLILKEFNLTQTELSKKTGIPQSAISRFDRNTSHKDEHVITICKVLGITLEELFEIKEVT